MSSISWNNAPASYGALENWVHDSLDLYKPALRSLLFPVFAHVVVELVLRGKKNEAKQLLNRHGELHREHGFKEQCEQMRILCSGDSDLPATLDNSIFAQRIRDRKQRFEVRLSSTAQMLLLTFLEENKMHEILYVLHSRLKIEKSDSHPIVLAREAGAQQGYGTLSSTSSPPTASSEPPAKRHKPSVTALSGAALSGMSNDDAMRINNPQVTPLRWGVIPKRAREEETKLVQDLVKKEGFASEKAKARNKKAINRAQTRARRPPWIGKSGPVPKLSRRNGNDYYRDMIEKMMARTSSYQEQAELEDAKKRVQLGYPSDHRKSREAWFIENKLHRHSDADFHMHKAWHRSGNEWKKSDQDKYIRKYIEESRSQALHEDSNGPVLPSMMRISLKNNYGGVACSAVSRDGVQVAAGYTDCNVVRVWRLDGEKHLGNPYGYTRKVGEDGTQNNQQEDSPLAASPQAVVEPAASLVGHSMGVTGCTFMPDNEWLLSCSEDSSVRLWSIAAKLCVASYRSSTESKHPVWDVACNPLGYYFASASHDRTATLWCTESASPLRRFVGHMSDVDTVRFHPNGSMIATGSLDRTARLWDVRYGGCVRIFGLGHQGDGHLGGVTALAFSPNGQFLVSGGQDTQLCVWDLAAGKMLTSIPWVGRGLFGNDPVSSRTHNKPSVRSLEFSMDGTVLASATTDHVVRCWDAALFHRWHLEAEKEEESLIDTHNDSSVTNGIGGNLSLGKKKNSGTGYSDADAVDKKSTLAVPSGGGIYRKDIFCAIPTGSTDILRLRFTERNLLLGVGSQVNSRMATNGQMTDLTVVI